VSGRWIIRLVWDCGLLDSTIGFAEVIAFLEVLHKVRRGAVHFVSLLGLWPACASCILGVACCTSDRIISVACCVLEATLHVAHYASCILHRVQDAFKKAAVSDRASRDAYLFEQWRFRWDSFFGW
jgi:hypothetical protein